MNWRVIFSIARKDILDAVRNYYILFAILMPIGLSLMFRLLLPSDMEMSNVKVIIYDPDRSQLTSNMHAISNIEVLEADSTQHMLEKMDQDRSIAGGLSIPAGFDQAVQAGERPLVDAYVSQHTSEISREVFQSTVIDRVWDLVRVEFPVQVAWHGAADPFLSADEQGTTDSSHTGISLDRYVLNMLLAMSLAMVGVFAVPTLLVEEKEKHTLEALLVSPGGPLEVALGKGLVGLFYCFIICGGLLALNNGFTGNIPLLLAAVFAGSIFTISAGLLMGGLFKTTHQVNTFSSLLMLLLILPSWTGMLGLPRALEVVLWFIPTHYLAKASSAALAGSNALNAWGNVAILAAIAAVLFAVVVWTIRRETH